MSGRRYLVAFVIRTIFISCTFLLLMMMIILIRNSNSRRRQVDSSDTVWHHSVATNSLCNILMRTCLHQSPMSNRSHIIRTTCCCWCCSFCLWCSYNKRRLSYFKVTNNVLLGCVNNKGANMDMTGRKRSNLALLLLHTQPMIMKFLLVEGS